MRKLLDKITGSDYFLLAVLLVLGTLNYGWVFFPVLGQIWTAINGMVVLGIVLAGVLYRIGQHLFFTSILVLAFLIGARPVQADDPILPDPTLTPGAVRSTDTDEICQPGYSKTVRHTSGKLKAKIYREYGIDRHAGHYEIDHLIPLGIGGADLPENLWPQSYDTDPWNASVKDRLELKLHTLVCKQGMDIKEAQKAIAENWIDAYRRFCPTEEECPSYRRHRD
jgi:hypothetical protein